MFASDLKGFVLLPSVIVTRKKNSGKTSLLFPLVLADFRKELSAEISGFDGKEWPLKAR